MNEPQWRVASTPSILDDEERNYFLSVPNGLLIPMPKELAEQIVLQQGGDV